MNIIIKDGQYKCCISCIMDTSDPNIRFDEKGVCNHCHRYEKLLPSRVFRGEKAHDKLAAIIKKIKSEGKGKDYDCIIGVSGGVDSTYVAYITKKSGLRPLAVHFDNGWNSELAVSNIEKVLDKLEIELYTYVIDWPSFKDLQLAFLKSSTPDGEVPTDHAINALLFKEASRRNIKYVITGMNFATESMAVPAWSYGHSDWRYIKSVYKRYGSMRLKGYPRYNFLNLAWWTFFKGINVVSILNYIEYNKDEAIELLQKELSWVYYGGKHYESVYTRFYQGYILPRKYKIDKRRGHLSDLIRSGQISRNDALERIKDPIYESRLLTQDKAFVIKKLKLSENQFDELMSLPNKTYNDYPNSALKVDILKKFVNILRIVGLYSK